MNNTHEQTLKEIHDLIDIVKVYIRHDGGDIEFVKFEDGILTLKILGACATCPLVGNTYDQGVKYTFLQEIKGLKDVVFVK